MSETESETDAVELSEEEAQALLDAVSTSVIERVIESGAMIPPEIIRRALAEALTEHDSAGFALMTSAFFEGREDAVREMLLKGEPDPADPGWGDVEGGGLRKSVHREMQICGRCSFEPMCIVARTIPPEMLIVVSRCLAFVPRSG